MTTKEFAKILQDKLTSEYGVDLSIASNQQIYRSLALICRQMMSENHKKFSYEQPFFEMMTRFQAALRMKNTTLVVIGFSFGDKHILSMINEALEQNPSFQLIIINYRDTGIIESDIFYKEAGERGNIMMVNETFKEFVDAYPNIKIYDQSDEYRLVKIVNEGN